MTLSPSDSPDWTGIAGGMRYLGPITLTGNGPVSFTLGFTPTSYDGSVYVVMDPSGSGTSFPVAIAVECTDVVPDLFTLDTRMRANDPPAVAFVARVLGANWVVAASADFTAAVGNVTVNLYVFAVPSYPLVLPSSTDNGLRVDIAAASSAAGIPGRAQPYDDQRTHAPGGNVRASVTFPAAAGIRWVIDLAAWTYTATVAAGARVTNEVVDSSGVIYQSQLLLIGTAPDRDREVIGPGAGIVGAVGSAVTVDFSAAGGVNTIERVSAAAYALAN